MEAIKLDQRSEKAIERLSKAGFDIPKHKALPINEDTVEAIISIAGYMFPRYDWESSYNLKYIAEKILCYYVGNGEFIKAAILVGRPFKVKGINALLK